MVGSLVPCIGNKFSRGLIGIKGVKQLKKQNKRRNRRIAKDLAAFAPRNNRYGGMGV